MAYRYTAPLSTYVDTKRPQIAELFTKRYEQNLAADTMLDQKLRQMDTAPFENDRRIAKQLRRQFEDTLEERSRRGDYHNLSRQVLLDANEFVKSYQPLKRNHDLYQGYKQTLQERLKDGDITKDIYSNSLNMSMYGNQGLQLDVSGAIDDSSFFSGYDPAKYVNIRERQFEAAKNIVKEKYGGTAELQFRQEPGGPAYDVIVEGRTVESISPQRIQAAVQPIMYDPDVQAYLNQEALFRTYDKTDDDVAGMLAERADNLRVQAGAAKSSHLQKIYLDAAAELDSARMSDSPKQKYQEYIKNEIFDQATRSTINTFAFKSVFGGGVKSAKINDMFLHSWKKSLEKEEQSGFDINTTLKERQPLTPQYVNEVISSSETIVKDNLESIKELTGYEGEITPEMVLGKQAMPQEVKEWFNVHPGVLPNYVRSIQSAITTRDTYQAKIAQAKQQADSSLNERYRDKTPTEILAQKYAEIKGYESVSDIPAKEMEGLEGFAKDIFFTKGTQDFIRSSENKAISESPLPSLPASTFINNFVKDIRDKILKSEMLKTAASKRGLTTDLGSGVLSISDLTLISNALVNELERVEEFKQEKYEEALASLSQPSTSVRATTSFEQHDDLIKELKTVPSSFDFQVGPLTDEIIQGGDLTANGLEIANIFMLTAPINGQPGYMVTLQPREGFEEVAQTYMEENLMGQSELFLFNNQIGTDALNEASMDGRNIFLTERDNVISSGRTSGVIRGPENTEIRMFNVDTSSEYAQVIEDGKALLPILNRFTGEYDNIQKVSPDDPKSHLPTNGGGFQTLLQLGGSQPYLFYGPPE